MKQKSRSGACVESQGSHLSEDDKSAKPRKGRKDQMANKKMRRGPRLGEKGHKDNVQVTQAQASKSTPSPTTQVLCNKQNRKEKNCRASKLQTL